jgi:hypothetical protein
MRKTLILSLFTLLFSGALMGQDRIINSFETAAEVDTFYWNNLEISDNADTLKSFIKLSHVNDPVADGDSALQVNYSAHNIESYGAAMPSSNIWHRIRRSMISRTTTPSHLCTMR